MPAQKLKSPPGVKTRARRSSIYQKGGLQLSSPPSSRTRRRSMYVPAKPSLQVTTEFSKVWATPVRPVDTALSATPEPAKPAQRKGSAKKAKAARSPSPMKMSPEKPPVKHTPQSPVSKSKKTPKSTAKKTPRSTAKKTPRSTAIKNISPGKKEKTPKMELKNATPEPPQKTKSPQKSNKKATPAASKKSQKSTRKASPVKSPKSAVKEVSTPKKITKDIVKTSTPSKSLEDMTGKSFYSTPRQTPIPQQRQDEVFVFSAKTTKSTKKTSAKRLTIKTPQKTPRQRTMMTPKKTPLRKTPANKKRSLNTSASSPSPAAKRTKTSVSCKGQKSAKPAEQSPAKQTPSPQKKVLTPTQMSSILRDVEETERQEERRSSLSPSPRPRKLARLAQEVAMSTPRVTKMGKRTSPKKLAEFHDRNQSCDMSLLNDTYNTDSRSGRCVIL